MMEGIEMIDIDKLVKSYGKNKVLKEASFHVKENEIFGLLGPNGAGKTTILECVEGLRNYDSGEIKVAGLDPEEAIKRGLIGIQLQSSSLPSSITAVDALKLFCKWKGVPPRYDLLDLFGSKDIYNKQYKTMSTGQKRRLHLALALVHDPKIVFLDEPTAGLDVEARVVLHNQIKNLKEKGVTIILASHDMAEVEALCDRVGILVNGKIKKIGTPSEIVLEVRRETIIKIKLDRKMKDTRFNNLQLQNYNDDYYYYFRTDDILEGLNELTDYIKKNAYKLIDISIDKPTLEERFIQIAEEVN